MADPEERPAPLIVRPKWGLKGRKNSFLRPVSPYLRVWMTAPAPLSEGLDPPLIHYHAPKQKKIKSTPRIQLDHNIYTTNNRRTKTRNTILAWSLYWSIRMTAQDLFNLNDHLHSYSYTSNDSLCIVYPIPRDRSSCILEPEKSVIIIYTFNFNFNFI